MPAGRPTDYKPEFVKQAEKLCELGATDAQLADFFDVSTKTIERWKVAHEEFCLALKIGKESADNQVERSLYQRAMGYEQEEVKIFMPGGATHPVYAPYIAKIPADTTAAIFWLKNRKPEEWRDRKEINHKVNDGDLSSLTDEKLEKIASGALTGSAGAAKSKGGKNKSGKLH